MRLSRFKQSINCYFYRSAFHTIALFKSYLEFTDLYVFDCNALFSLNWNLKDFIHVNLELNDL